MWKIGPTPEVSPTGPLFAGASCPVPSNPSPVEAWNP
jgi:hypothetical protein